MVDKKIFIPLQPQLRQIPNGALVQLVRMPACHAGGHGFESRTHRQKTYKSAILDCGLFYLLSLIIYHANGSPDKYRAHYHWLCLFTIICITIRFSTHKIMPINGGSRNLMAHPINSGERKKKNLIFASWKIQC